MRVRVTFNIFKNSIIDFDYQHQLQGLIYNILNQYNTKYASWLHQEGYTYNETQHFKLFAYSGIIFVSKMQIIKNKGFLLNASYNNPAEFYFEISSPVEIFIQYLVRGIFKEGNSVNIGKLSAYISKLETLKSINTETGNINVKPLECPIVVKKLRAEKNGYDFIYHIDNDFINLLSKNTLKKYNILMGTDMNEEIEIKIREDLAEDKYNRDNKKTWLSSVGKWEKDNTGKPRRIVTLGTKVPLTVTGSPKVLSKIVDLGLGESTSMGCGYVVEIGKECHPELVSGSIKETGEG